MSAADGSGVLPDLAASRLYAAVVSDILDDLGHRDHTLDPAIRPLRRGAVIAGPASPFVVTEVHRIPEEPYTGEIGALDDIRPDLLALFGHFVVLSLLAVGGAITTVPDMHRFIVAEHHWLTDAQFTASIAIAQAAPGPNVLFVAVLGWNVAGPFGARGLIFLVGRLYCRRRSVRDRTTASARLTPYSRHSA